MAMENMGNGLYKYIMPFEMEASRTNVIFNNGGSGSANQYPTGAGRVLGPARQMIFTADRQWIPYVDKEQLAERYNELSGIENDGVYTASSWAAFEEALAEAKAVLEGEYAGYQVYCDTANLLTASKDGLVARAQDYELAVLGTFVTLYEGSVEALYTPESWAVLQDAMNVAKALIADPANASSAAVGKATTDLIAAGNALVPSLSKSPLEGAIADAKALLAEGNWIPASAENLQKAIDKAEALLKKADLTQAEMVSMILELNDAMSLMFEKGNKTSLQLLVNSANRLDGDLFTADSWTVFSDALTAAQKVLNDANATADEVLAAYNTLSNAISQLVPKANFSGLKTALDLANTILANADKYVPASIAGLQAEADKAQQVYDNANATQAEVDAAQAALMTKVLGARKPANKAALKSSLGRSGSLAGQMSQAGMEALSDAVEKAEQVANEPAATQEAVDEAVKAVEKAALVPVIVTAEEPETTPAAPHTTEDADTANPEAGALPAEEAQPAAPGAGVEPNIPGEATVAPQSSSAFVLWIVAGAALLLAAVAAVLLKKRGRKGH